MVLDQSQNGVCGGDSGGPLYAYENGRLIFIGVTSAGIDHKTTRLDQAPKICSGIALFASVVEKLEWIQKTSSEL
jgi:V8-like Glu-specific endopeptidase